jgi:hypothetical protein
MEKRNKKRIAVAVGFMVVLFFMSVSAYAEEKDMGPGECLGIKTYNSILVTNESWISEASEGASSLMRYTWQYFNRDAAMETINMLSNLILKNKSLYDMYSYENKNQIQRRQERPYDVTVYLFDNGNIQIQIRDKNTGRDEAWRFK